MQYITDVQLLNTLKHPKIINSSQTLLTYTEKTIPFAFKEYIPRTLVSSDVEEIIAWVNLENRAILKSVHGYGGQEVILVDKNNPEKIRNFVGNFSHVIAQEFLPKINLGDKRVLIVADQIVGTIRRTPKIGSILANMAQGGTASVSDLTAKEQEICEKVLNWCQAHSIMFAGIDLIDERLIEVNITCPTGYKVLHDLNPSIKLDQIVANAVHDSLRNYSSHD